jgi:hypothetical protein
MLNADTECFYKGQLRTTHASAPDRPLSHETRRGAAARAASKQASCAHTVSSTFRRRGRVIE